MPIENIHSSTGGGISGGITCAYCGVVYMEIDEHYDQAHSKLIKTLAKTEEERYKRINKQAD